MTPSIHVHQAPRVLLEITVWTVRKERMARQDRLDLAVSSLPIPLIQTEPAGCALLVLVAQLDEAVLLGPLVPLVQMATRDVMATTDDKDHRDQLANLEHQEVMASLEPLDPKETMGLKEQRDHKDPRELPAPAGPRGQLVHPDVMAPVAEMVNLAHKDLQALRETLVQKVATHTKAHRDPLARTLNTVRAPGVLKATVTTFIISNYCLSLCMKFTRFKLYCLRTYLSSNKLKSL